MNRRIACLAILLGTAVLNTAAQAAEVNVYSARNESLIKPLLDRFTEQSGISVNLLTGKANALIERLRAEGRNSPADLLITTDAGRLVLASDLGLFQAVESDVLEDRIYNQSLMASLIEHHGIDTATSWAQAVRGNMARDPQGNDRAQIKAVAAGECDVALVNTYYLGIMLSDEEQREAGAAVRVHFPNQDNRGTHVNISGAGVTAHAPNRDEAQALIEFLAGDEAQSWYASTNHEYPVRDGISPSDLVASFGTFDGDTLNVSVLGKRNAEAVRAFDAAGWE